MFKKLLLTAALLLSVMLTNSFADVDTWHTANQATVGWDAPTTFQNGDPIPQDAVLEYDLYTATLADHSDAVKVGHSTSLTGVLSFTAEGNYIVGVSAVRVVSGSPIGSSDIAWSNVPEYCLNGATFGISYYLVPDLPDNIYKQ